MHIMTFSSVFWLSEEMNKDNTQRSTDELDTRRKERASRVKQRRVHITLNPTNLYRNIKLRAYIINNFSSGTGPAQKGAIIRELNSDT